MGKKKGERAFAYKQRVTISYLYGTVYSERTNTHRILCSTSRVDAQSYKASFVPQLLMKMENEMTYSNRLWGWICIVLLGASVSFFNCTSIVPPTNENQTETVQSKDAGPVEKTSSTEKTPPTENNTPKEEPSSTEKPPKQCNSNPSYKKDIWPIFQNGCSCHAGGVGGLQFSDAAGFLGLIGKASSCNGTKYLVAGHPEQSYILNKMEGAKGICGNSMPTAGPLPKADLDKVKDWICNGAKDN